MTQINTDTYKNWVCERGDTRWKCRFIRGNPVFKICKLTRVFLQVGTVEFLNILNLKRALFRSAYADQKLKAAEISEEGSLSTAIIPDKLVENIEFLPAAFGLRFVTMELLCPQAVEALSMLE